MVTSELEGILRIPESSRRTAAIAAWVQNLFEKGPLVLVGGAAVELYTGGAYTSGDLDFVRSVPPVVARRVEA